MQLAFILLLIAAPLLELALLIKLGQALGFWPVMALVIGTAIGGALLIRAQGFSMLRRMMDAVEPQRPQLQPVIDGGLLVAAGVLLILPGPITDTLGLLLLLPPVRWLVAKRFLRSAVVLHRVDIRGFGRRPSDPARNAADSQSPPARDGPVIEGEFERVDEPGDRRPAGSGPEPRT